jgi:hypothetical protein
VTAIEIFDCEQNSETWMRTRMGIPTASEFATVLAKGRDGGASVTRRKYLYRLAGEIITGEPTENYSNVHMERGHAMEAEARELYGFVHDAPLSRVGFVRRGNYGCSPDSLIGDDGILEIKTAMPHILIEYILADRFPAEHVAQCQGALFVTGRQWLDIAVYWPKMPLFIKRIHADTEYHGMLSRALDDFTNELALVVERLRKIAA